MQTSKAKRNLGPDDPAWVLLAELSLGDFLSDPDRRDEPAAGFLLQSLRELEVSPEYVENMARTLAGFAKEAWARYKQGRLEFPGRIRIFCQKKIIDDANSEKPLRPYYTEQGKKQRRIFPDSGANTTGGWGYFMIEQGEDLLPVSSAIPHNYIDLYLYKEGEQYG